MCGGTRTPAGSFSPSWMDQTPDASAPGAKKARKEKNILQISDYTLKSVRRSGFTGKVEVESVERL